MNPDSSESCRHTTRPSKKGFSYTDPLELEIIVQPDFSLLMTNQRESIYRLRVVPKHRVQLEQARVEWQARYDAKIRRSLDEGISVN